MTEVSESTLDLIRKLHALATNKGATEAEAQVAMNKMQALLFAHNLTMDEVGPDGKEKAAPAIHDERVTLYERERFDPKRTFTTKLSNYEREWRVRLASAVAKYTFCRILASPAFTSVIFVGTAQNVAAVKEIWRYAVEQIEDLSYIEMDAYKRAGGWENGRRWRRGWLFGCIERVEERLHDNWEALKNASEKSTALVVFNDKAVALRVRELSGGRPINYNNQYTSGTAAGYAAGNRIDFNAPTKKLGGGRLG